MSAFEELEQRFTSGNDVPVPSVTLSRDLYERLRAENEALRKDAEWISVEDRLPENADHVLINELWDKDNNKNSTYYLASFMKRYRDDNGKYRSNGFFIESDGSVKKELVTHWRPLPQAPDRAMKG